MTHPRPGLIVVRAAGLGLALAMSSAAVAGQVNTSALSENGWFSDDTRADGTGTILPAGTNLISNTLTDDPEATASGMASHDADINAQIVFGDAPGAEPVGTYPGAVHLRIAAGSGSGKSQISHRKDDATGHGPGSGFGPGFMAEYSWMGDGTVSVTASLKFGIKTSEFGSTGVSGRTGENAWDKVLIYEPGNLNGGTSDGLWHTETIDYTTGTWWFFDRTASASIIGTPMTLSAMSTSAIVVGGGPKTVADVYALITAPGAIITSVQFGIGSGNGGGSVYVNQLETNVYRSGDLTTFGTPSPYDQNVTPDVIFGSGNVNGSFTVDRQNGIELGLRGKLRYLLGSPANIFNSNGDGTYTFNTGGGGGPAGNSEWSFEWSVNTDYDDNSPLRKVGDLTYEIGMDNDPSAGTDYLVFDPISIGTFIPYTIPLGPIPYWDHSMGDNTTPNGGGVEAADMATYAGYLTTYNVAQNSWKPTFYQNTAPYSWDPDVPGRYDYYLAAFDAGVEVARTQIAIIVVDGMTLSLEADPCQTDQDPVTSGLQIAVELWLRNPNEDEVTGYQAFLEFNTAGMTYVGASSSYSATPFTSHLQPIATAEVSAGKLRLDGSTFPSLVGTTDDALLATLLFTVAECDAQSVAFDASGPFFSEASYLGLPYATDTLDSSAVHADVTDPMITCPADITQPADAGVGNGCESAVVEWSDPVATDSCPLSGVTVVCVPPSGSVFPAGVTTMVTCTATDGCGNTETCSFGVTVTETNTVSVKVQLVGVTTSPTRCIYFVPDSCSMTADIPLAFDATGLFDGDIEIPCGEWTMLCAKDEQHTQWDTADLVLDVTGTKYELSPGTPVLELRAGDTDNDGDVDINDVTLLVAQFGSSPEPFGDCPWNGMRGTDFSDNGAVGSEDYSLLSPQWLTLSSCACPDPLILDPTHRKLSISTAELEPWIAERTDLNRDGRVDHEDVRIFEVIHGLSGKLSESMRKSAELSRGD